MKGFLVCALLLAAAPTLHAQQQAPAGAAAASPAPAATASAPAPASAVDMADDAQVDRLMAVMHARESTEAVWPRLEAMQRQMAQQAAAGKPLDAAHRAQLDAYLEKTSARMREAMAWERLEPAMRDAYRSTFDRAEMEAMIGFYGSPEGQQVIAKTPLLMENSMRAMQGIIGPMMEKLKADLEAMTPAAPRP